MVVPLTSIRPLRIAQIAPLAEAVPPRLYGGTERVVAHLTDALVELGHDVTLFASADARTSARLVADAQAGDPARSGTAQVGRRRASRDAARGAQARADEFDVLHFHIDLLHFPLFEELAARTLTTLHGRLDLADLPDVYRRWPQFPLVSISEHQRRPLPFANWLATVQHGMPPDAFRLLATRIRATSPSSAASRPRSAPIARSTSRGARGLPIKLAAKVDAADAAYFRDVIEPLLHGADVEFLGEVDDAGKNELLGGAAALIFPIDWPEPFGLVMIEAMACGTPVIAWDVGSVPEDGRRRRHRFHRPLASTRPLPPCGASTRSTARRIRATFERRFSVTTMSNELSRPLRPARPAGARRAGARAAHRRRTIWPRTPMARYALKYDEEFLVADALGDITGDRRRSVPRRHAAAVALRA